MYSVLNLRNEIFFYSAEIEKYRNLYNDIRSKFTILNGDFEHARLEHQDEIGKKYYYILKI